MVQIITTNWWWGGGVWVYKYKWSVNTYNDLPTTWQKVWDVYNVVTAHTTDPKFPAWSNLAWTGTEWDVLWGNIDLSEYQKKLVEWSWIDIDWDTNEISVESSIISWASAWATAVQPWDLCTVATSWKYCDLTGTPSLCTVATTGKYCDLTWTPDLSTYQTKSCMVCNLTWADDNHYPSAKAVVDALQCAGAGDMMKSVYDPCNKNSNAFDYCNFINTPTIPTDNCQLANSCGYITSSALSWYAQTCSLCTVATTGKYCDLTWTPTIPTDNCQLANWCWYTTCTWTLVASDLTPYAKTCSLCTVATSWKYCDLSWTPTIPTDNCQLWNGCWFTTCTWTITQVCMNWASCWTSGVINLGTVITDISWKQDTLTASANIDITCNKVSATNTYIVTEGISCTTYTWEKWVAPYNTSYCYTNICIDPASWIKWQEWSIYTFDIDTEMIATSACRNVRVKIWSGEYIPVMWTTSVLAWSSYFTKANIRQYQYSTKYQSCWALHLFTDSNTTYSAMTNAEATTWTCTAWRSIAACTLKCAINYFAPISDTAYWSAWDGKTTTAPSQNAVYDKINAMCVVPSGWSCWQVLTNTWSGCAWCDVSWGDVLVSNQCCNILTSWMMIWAWCQCDYDNLGSYDNNTVYLTI